MGLLEAGAEEPQSKALRYVVSGVALVLLLGASVWFFLRYTTEKHTVEHFMHAVVVGDTQQAYQIWHRRRVLEAKPGITENARRRADRVFDSRAVRRATPYNQLASKCGLLIEPALCTSTRNVA